MCERPIVGRIFLYLWASTGFWFVFLAVLAMAGVGPKSEVEIARNECWLVGVSSFFCFCLWWTFSHGYRISRDTLQTLTITRKRLDRSRRDGSRSKRSTASYGSAPVHVGTNAYKNISWMHFVAAIRAGKSVWSSSRCLFLFSFFPVVLTMAEIKPSKLEAEIARNEYSSFRSSVAQVRNNCSLIVCLLVCYRCSRIRRLRRETRNKTTQYHSIRFNRNLFTSFSSSRFILSRILSCQRNFWYTRI